MKTQMLLLTALAALVFAGCSSTPAKVNETIKATTFNFVNGGVPKNADFTDNRDAMHKTIQDAITRNLSGQGLSRAAGVGDVTVAYLVILGNNATIQSVEEYFGYGPETAALRDKAHDAYSASKKPNRFEAGTLLIDIVDSRTFKVLRRNYVVRPLLRNVTAEVRAARIQEAVDEALAGVQVAR